MRLHLVRHPQPLIEPGLCYGRSDLDISPDETHRIAMALRQTLPQDLPVYTSPLQRCSKLARALQPTELHLDDRLMEMDFGQWEMQPWSAIAHQQIDDWSRQLAHYRPGGGESLCMMAERIAGFYRSLLARPHPEAMIICHAGSIRLLSLCGQGLAPEQMAQQAAERPHSMAYGAIVTLETGT